MKEGFTRVTITQLLRIARVKVLANKEIIIFVISFPRPKLLCKNITIFPVSHAGRILHLLDNIIADCEGSITAVTSCVDTPMITFCRDAVNGRRRYSGGK